MATTSRDPRRFSIEIIDTPLRIKGPRPMTMTIPAWATKCKPPTEKFSTKQIIYVLIQTLSSTGINWGANYGIGIALYQSKPAPTLWLFPLPIAGHYGSLCILIPLICWILVNALQTLDILNGVIEPVSPRALYGYWPQSTSYQWWLRTSDLVLCPEITTERPWSQRILSTLLRSLPWMPYTFVLLWPLFTGVTFALWGDDGYNSFPLPEYLTATFGAAIAFITIPWWSIMTLVSIGDRIERIEQQVVERSKDFMATVPVPSTSEDADSPFEIAV